MTQPLDYESKPALQGVKVRSPLGELLVLALPTIAQMASYTLMQFIDTWMLTRVGSETAVAAAGNAGMDAFLIISLGSGTLMVVNTLVSQSFGHRNYSHCGRYLWQGIWFSVFFGLLILPLLPFSSLAFALFRHEPGLVKLETVYLQITASASIIKLISMSMGQFLLAVNRPGMVFIGSALGVSANVLAALVLMFGWPVGPKLGLVGAAWAQNVGMSVECLVLALLALRPGIRRTFAVLDWRLRRTELLTLLRVGLPSGLQMVADVLAWAVFTQGIMGLFGTNAMAANIYMFRYMAVSFMPAFGISTAVTALVGRYIGMGRPDLAERRADLGFRLSVAYMLSCGLAFFLWRQELVRLFSDDPQVVALGATLMVFAAVYQLIDAIYINYSGALRGAGDTLVPALATAGLNWSITVGGGYAMAGLWPGLGPIGPWLTATVYGATLAGFLYVRFRRGGWRNIRLERETSADKVTAE